MMKTDFRRNPVYLALRLAKLGNPACGHPAPALKEFHVSRASRARFQFNQALFSITGNVVLADFNAVRIFAQKINEKRDLPHFPEKTIRAGSLNAMGLIDEILHYVVSLYVVQVQPQVFKMLMTDLENKLGGNIVRKTLIRFCTEFPPQVVQKEQVSAEEYLLGTSKGVFNRETVLEEMILFWLANANPAFSPFRELFDDSSLAKESGYRQFVDEIRDFFSQMPPFGPDGQNLVELLRSPAVAYPESLSGQLLYIREKWGLLLGKYSDRLLSSLDLIKEDEKKYLPGPGPAEIFAAGAAPGESAVGEDKERFSMDREWMPRLVLMAKTVYVWLDQLSKKYGWAITTLDQVPDEELDGLAGWGFTGLWLIGVWERSRASRRIKQKCGNPEAMASAYSLYRYEIAADLGGEAALENLKARAQVRGIRLASDMVPNHMGIDSLWVIEHPDWFIALDHSPFPAYSFSGENLSSDPRVAIYLEDHYFDRSDAAVVFKWVDRRSGVVRFIYHGNDGTRMPWNDTAQLNYLRPEVREAVAQTILAVARKFPIIRFDAAMTLTRKHYQRLWFPPPGRGGDIPSRSGLGMGQEHFDRAMPGEFWRDIVERMAGENPDTLLLAEAFWMMESYFVRSLGMHRVYNSAFMNFLKMEENAKFRQSLKNVLEFNPEILKRYVNFMNNPDEETAAAQFGNGDKYFAACTLMAALPGLPMFGHGQIEGFREKYGMEYHRAYMDEHPDEELVRRHERQIFPLLRKRALFSGVEDFLLYDFYLGNGAVDENVVAFSNQSDGERCLVVVHNRFADTAGWIRVSAAYADKDHTDLPRALKRKDLGLGLGLHDEPGWFVVYRDMVSGSEYIRSSRDVCSAGMFFELNAYRTHVFLDFREMADDARGHFAKLNAYLQGRGVASLEKAMREMALQPLHGAVKELCRPEMLDRMLAVFQGSPGSRDENILWLELEGKINDLMHHATVQAQAPADAGHRTAAATVEDLLGLRALFFPAEDSGAEITENTDIIRKYLREYFSGQPQNFRLFICWIYNQRMTGLADEKWTLRRRRFHEWQLDEALAGNLRVWGMDENSIATYSLLTDIFFAFAETVHGYVEDLGGAGEGPDAAIVGLIGTMMANEQVRAFLRVNRFQEQLFFDRANFTVLCEWLTVLVLWELRVKKTGKDGRQFTDEMLEVMNFLPALAAQSEYKLDKFLKKLAALAAE